MTANQIAYSNYMEQSRHNLVGENETNRHNIAQEYETNRTNVANEQLRLKEHKEAKKHNRATEKETSKHNRITEAQKDTELTETERANKQREENTKEQTRANAEAQQYTAYMRYLATISAAQISADSNAYVASVNKIIHEMDNISKEKVASMNNAASKYNVDKQEKNKKAIAELENATKKLIDAKNRALKALEIKNNYELGKARNDIQAELNHIQEMYNQGKLDNDELRLITDAMKGFSVYQSVPTR